MKFLPVLRAALLLSCVAVLCGCATAANRRELYNTTKPNGPWHDYEKNRLAEADTGTSGTLAPPAPTQTHTRATPQPPSTPPAPLPGESAADQAAALAPAPAPAPTAAPPAELPAAGAPPAAVPPSP